MNIIAIICIFLLLLSVNCTKAFHSSYLPKSTIPKDATNTANLVQNRQQKRLHRNTHRTPRLINHTLLLFSSSSPLSTTPLPTPPCPPASSLSLHTKSGRIPTIRDYESIDDDNIINRVEYDNILQDLASPAPESFHTIDVTVDRLNTQMQEQYSSGKFDDGETSFFELAILDLKTLAELLVKPGHQIILYKSDQTTHEAYSNRNKFRTWRWKTYECTSQDKAGLNFHISHDCDELLLGNIRNNSLSVSQLYHNCTTLALIGKIMSVSMESTSTLGGYSKEELLEQVEKRLVLTHGSDLRGRKSADASFQLALSGITHKEQHSSTCSRIFNALVDIAIHEMRRVGHRSSFKPKQILHMVEKFAASGLDGSHVSKLYFIAASCLIKKEYEDKNIIRDLTHGNYGLHCERPLLWLWRFSSRLNKVKETAESQNNDEDCNHDMAISSSKPYQDETIYWHDYFDDTSKDLVVDLGCGCGVSILNLCQLGQAEEFQSYDCEVNQNILKIDWTRCNYIGTDLNTMLISYAKGVLARRKESDVHYIRNVAFFCTTTLNILECLESYPGDIAMLVYQFPSPYRLRVVNTNFEPASSNINNSNGNSQLPSYSKEGYMITKNVATMSTKVLKRKGYILFQTKCEDVAIYTKDLFLQSSAINERLRLSSCLEPIKDIESMYDVKQKGRPKRLQEWLKIDPQTERAEGWCWSKLPFLPTAGRSETEVNCDYEGNVIHRCLFEKQSQ